MGGKQSVQQFIKEEKEGNCERCRPAVIRPIRFIRRIRSNLRHRRQPERP
jgi:hypothetical protein